jgi:hypothetical protein
MPVKGGYLLATGGGALLLWSGLKGKSWSQTFRTVLAGKDPGTILTAYPISPGTPGTPSPPGGDGVPGPAGGTHSKNVAIGKTLATAYGWGSGSEWDALYQLWTRESGWDNKARNPSSGAYGIPQALPPTKLPKLGQAPVSSASAQISWGLGYIKSRYGSPSAAWAHENANGWY